VSELPIIQNIKEDLDVAALLISHVIITNTKKGVTTWESITIQFRLFSYFLNIYWNVTNTQWYLDGNYCYDAIYRLKNKRRSTTNHSKLVFFLF